MTSELATKERRIQMHPSTIKLTDYFFHDKNPLIKVSPETRMRFLWSIYDGVVLPVIYTVEAQFLMDSPAYQEIKSTMNLRIEEGEGIATITITKKELEKLGIKLTYKKTLKDQITAPPYKSSDKEKRLHNEALYVLTCYNEAREHLYKYCDVHSPNYKKTHHDIRKERYIPDPLLFTTTNRKHCIKIHEFCENNNINDIRIFVRSIFKHFGWKVVPPWQYFYRGQAYDQWMSNKDSTISEIAESDEVRRQMVNQPKAKRKSPFRDTYPNIEKTKAAFIRDNKAEICMDQIRDLLGYHPHSEVCKICPIAEDCKVKLDKSIKMLTKGIMDVMALRTGDEDIIDVQERLLNASIDIDVYQGAHDEED